MKKAILSSALVLSSSIIAAPMTAHAATYTNGICRGVEHYSYIETDFTWSTDSRNNITSSSAYQWTSGILAQVGSTTCTYAAALEHDWVAISKSVIGIGKLSYTITYRDTVELYNSGNMYWVSQETIW